MKRLLRDATNKHWLVALSVVMLATAVVSLLLASKELYATVRTQSANVKAAQQAGAPIVVKVTSITPSDHKTPVFTYEVMNISLMSVKAYAIRHDTTIGSTLTSGASHFYALEQYAFLHPNFSHSKQFGSSTYGGDVEKVVLSVDYVEFEDGTTWGRDEFKTSERLAGQHTGHQSVVENLRETLETKGKRGLLSALVTEVDDLQPPQSKSQQWKEGFRVGLKIARARLRHAQESGGMTALEYELEKQMAKPKREQ